MKTKFLCALAFLPIIGSCGVQPSYTDPVTITDMQNRSVTFDRAKLNRVVCIGAGALRFYSYIGDMSKLVAVEDIDSANIPSDIPIGKMLRPYYVANKEFLSTLPSCGVGGPNAQVANDELILQSRADIVISFLDSVEANNDLFAKTQIPVVALKQGRDGIFDEVTLNSFKLLGDIFNRQARYEEVKNYIETCKNDFKDLTIDETKTYYMPCIAGWGQIDFLRTAANNVIFKYAKVKDVLSKIDDSAKTQSSAGVLITMESLLAANPDYAFVDGAGFQGALISKYKGDAQFKANVDNLAAFQNKETYKTLPYNAYYTNLEIQLMSTYYVASVAHPTEFADFNISVKVDEISTKLNGKALYQEMKDSTMQGSGEYQKFDISVL